MAATRERIQHDPSLPPVLIPGRTLNEICAHALETIPEECCGLISGSAETPYARVHRCRNTMTMQHENDPAAFPRDGTQAYYMSEIDYLRALEEAESRGDSVTAVYHSHVDAGIYLSEMDQDYLEKVLFPFPEAAQIVLAVGPSNVDRVLGVGIFERDASRGRFRGRRLEALPEGESPSGGSPSAQPGEGS